MKRIVTFSIDNNGRKKVESISAPINTDDIDLNLDTSIYGLIDSSYVDPIEIEGKIISLYYNDTTQTIDVEYNDITYDDLNPQEKIIFLKKENDELKNELELTQQALFELDWAINGSNDEYFDEPENDSLDINDDAEEIDEFEENLDVSDEDSNLNIEEINSEFNNDNATEEEINAFDLQKEIDEANSGDIVILTNDVILDNPIGTNKSIIIDLNGHNIEAKSEVLYLRSDNANVTFIGEGNVSGATGTDASCIRVAKGKLNINGGKYSAGLNELGEGNICIYASGSGKIIINDGEFTTSGKIDDKYLTVFKKPDSNAELLITGGKFINNTTCDEYLAEGKISELIIDENMFYSEIITKPLVENNANDNEDENVSIENESMEDITEIESENSSNEEIENDITENDNTLDSTEFVDEVEQTVDVTEDKTFENENETFEEINKEIDTEIVESLDKTITDINEEIVDEINNSIESEIINNETDSIEKSEETSQQETIE